MLVYWSMTIELVRNGQIGEEYLYNFFLVVFYNYGCHPTPRMSSYTQDDIRGVGWHPQIKPSSPPASSASQTSHPSTAPPP